MLKDSENFPKANILIVDDIAENLDILSSMMKGQGYDSRPVPNGNLALQAARNYPPDLILLDINMPAMDGYEVCRELKADPNLEKIPVIFISGLTETKDIVKAFNAGGADYVTKPFQFEEVSARVSTHLKLRQMMAGLEELVQEKVKEISESQIATIYALAKLSESRDDLTGKHIDRVGAFIRLIAENMKHHPDYRRIITNQYIDLIENASSLHDIGKVGIPDNILLKPGKLTLEEFNEIKKHTIIGSETLQSVSVRYPKNSLVKIGIEIARSHHERWDGKGYPDGLSGESIPLSARIVAMSDVYDALRTERPYKKGMPHDACCKIIVDGEGSQFDPGVISAFRAVSDSFEKKYNSLI